MVARFHIDTDFLVYALATSGPERMKLRALAATDAVLEISAVAWYEFCRGPRTPEQIASHAQRSRFLRRGRLAYGEA